ncbi:MAG: hypothetical protein ACJA1J_001335 [Sulfitobacter pontiacus]|jgi:hypothetical protein
MAATPYHITYADHPDVRYPSKSGMLTYIKDERTAWGPFLDELPNMLKGHVPFRHNNSQSPETLSAALEILEGRLEDVNQFNQATRKAMHGGSIALPPNSDSAEGRLILALFNGEKTIEALAVYIRFIELNFGAQPSTNLFYGPLSQKGERLLESGIVAAVLPFSKVSSAKLAGAARKAANHNDALEQEVAKAATINEEYENRLNEFLEEQKQRGKDLENGILDKFIERTDQYDEWKSGIDGQVSERFEEAEKRIAGVERLSKIKLQQQEEEFGRLQDLFATQLRLRAPVKLWEGRENKHSTNSNAALLRLFIFGAITAIIAIVVPVFAGDYIAGSFFEIVCSPGGVVGEAELSCERYFSAKGPLTVTGLLLAMSILTWITRLQYRIHLSERHLSLDASEKKAFAETYLAMKEGEDVGQANEAIVLASLFRPTQDGIIRDDETGMDLSAVALLAKQLGKSNP